MRWVLWCASWTWFFWVVAPLFVASLSLADPAAALFGERGPRTINAVLLSAVVIHLLRRYGIVRVRAQSSRGDRAGEWTNRQLSYALVFTISFFLSGFFTAVAAF